jgi:hypothetical protein
MILYKSLLVLASYRYIEESMFLYNIYIDCILGALGFQ